MAKKLRLPGLSGLKAASLQRRDADFRKELLHYEARLGGELFGPIPAGHRREFFCLDKHTWVWHEEWLDEHKHRHILTTRYDVRPGSILKSQGGQHYQALSAEESHNLRLAIHLYAQKMQIELPKLAPAV